MSSIFRHFIRSRKKKKSRSLNPVNIKGDVSKPSSEKTALCSQDDPCATKKNQPQHQLLSATHECDEHHQNQHPGQRFETRVTSNSNVDNATSKTSKDARNFFMPKSLRRKAKHDTEQGTKKSLEATDNAHSLTSSQSSSAHERRVALNDTNQQRRRSKSFGEAASLLREKEIQDSCEPSSDGTSKDTLDRKKYFKAPRRKSKDDAEHNTHSSSSTTDTITSGGSAPNKPAIRRIQRVASYDDEPEKRKLKPANVHFNQNNMHKHRKANISFLGAKDGTKPRTGKRSFGNTKTVMMNGDIVVTKLQNSKLSSSETVTITSTTSSNSMARAMRRETERSARAASALDDKGNDLFEKGYFDRAMTCYTKALKLKRRTFAHILQESDDLEEELMLRNEDGDLSDPQALVSMATSLNNIGYLRQRSGDATPEETMAAYKKSLRIKRRILGNDNLSVGKTLNNIGSVHYLKRDFEKALSSYDEALQIMKANLGEKHPDVATVMSNIGDVHLAQGNRETTIKYYRLALAIRWEAFGGKSPRVIRLLEKISNLEIGDMNARMANQKTQSAWGDDGASDKMVGSDFQPVSEVLKLLQQQVQSDIDQISELERNAAVEMLKDKIIVIRGMRDVWNGNGSGPELLDNDCASVQTAMSRISIR